MYQLVAVAQICVFAKFAVVVLSESADNNFANSYSLFTFSIEFLKITRHRHCPLCPVSAPALLILVCGAPVSVSHCDHLDSRAAHTNRPSETLPIIEKTSWMSESCCGLSWGECPGASCRHSPPLSPSQVSNSDVSRMRPEEGRAGRAGYIVYWWYVRAGRLGDSCYYHGTLTPLLSWTAITQSRPLSADTCPPLSS